MPRAIESTAENLPEIAVDRITGIVEGHVRLHEAFHSDIEASRVFGGEGELGAVDLELSLVT